MPFSTLYYQAANYVKQASLCVKDIDWFSAVDWIYSVDWYNELRLMATALLLASIIIPVVMYLSGESLDLHIWVRVFHWIRLRTWNRQGIMPAVPTQVTGDVKTPQRTHICPAPKNHDDPTQRVNMTDAGVYIRAWPSKGGVIIHTHAEAVDLEFLGLDPVDPPTKRLPNQDDEDDFCQRLLLLGAKWWDSEARFRLLALVDKMDRQAEDALDEGREPIPTMRERRWVSVAWPSTGGLWIAEFDTPLYGILEAYDVQHQDIARLGLACTMDERSKILQDHLRAKFYKDVKEYHGYAFLNSWEEKETGEVGPLMPLRSVVGENNDGFTSNASINRDKLSS